MVVPSSAVSRLLLAGITLLTSCRWQSALSSTFVRAFLPAQRQRSDPFVAKASFISKSSLERSSVQRKPTASGSQLLRRNQPLSPTYSLASVSSPEDQSTEGSNTELVAEDEASDDSEETVVKAQTRTVNERLLQELEAATEQEKYGAKSKMGKKMFGLDGFLGSRKTDDERRAAIEEAQDLNGVNPIVTIAGGVVAIAMAGGLWFATNELGAFFALHPVAEDSAYFVQRIASVVRNASMGLISLAAGFFGVTGVGILALGVRVAYGVATGELDPAPIPQKKTGLELLQNAETEPELPDVWDLMLGRRNARRKK
jgi:Protein of unknown function (DUF3082)